MAEYEVVEDDEPLPIHDPDVCGRCAYITNGDNIFYTREQRERATIGPEKMLACAVGVRDREDNIVELGWFTLPKQPAHAMWYLFQCPDCLMLCRNLTSGYEPRLRCTSCGHDWYLTQERFYLNAGRQRGSLLDVIREALGWRKKYREDFKKRRDGGSRP
jgi:hypothetical protein